MTGVDGIVRVDGRERNLDAFRKISCYIQQDDRLEPLLTTWESMRLAADLKLGTDTPAAEKEETVSGFISGLTRISTITYLAIDGSRYDSRAANLLTSD